VDGCLACDLSSGRVPLPGGVICETSLWIVEHCVGPLGLGTLVVKPKRHVVHVAELDHAEAGELGPLLRDSARCAAEVTSPDQVYVTLWSHAGGRPCHIHWVVQPVTRAELRLHGLHGPKLQVAMLERGAAPAPRDVEEIAERLRAAFARAQRGDSVRATEG
jgi:diadenosine tetraphosphate (Ap4A) HIT family hydrolase